jgi:putative transposase
MNNLYMLCGISKQSHLKAIKEEQEQLAKVPLYLNLIYEARELHPVMGLRAIYDMYQPEGIGRDAFIFLGKTEGLQLEQRQSPTRTTFSVKSNRYRNLLEGKWFTDVNQVWTSDITYFRIGEKYYYITFIMDVYSRRIIGYHVADNMRAENNVYALLMALNLRGIEYYSNRLIHHSDKGGQYISNDYTNLLGSKGIAISMCNEVYENAHIERVNGIIKNYYLIHYGIKNENQLIKGVEKAVFNYNHHKPHSALNKVPPIDFEAQLTTIPKDNRVKIQVFTIKQNVPNYAQLQLDI